MTPVIIDRFFRTYKKRFTSNRAILGAIIFIVFVMYFNKIYHRKRCHDLNLDKRDKNQLFYMLHGDNVDSGYLKHVILVLERLGYSRVENNSNFDLLWSHVYPFGDRAPFPKLFLQNLAPYQKVNHFPGSGYFTNKVDLVTSDLKHIPRAFHLPKQKMQLMQYAHENPSHLFVQKSNSHRGIKIVKIEDINMDQKGTFVQEYVQKPLLVDGRKFDIGVYTILTSVDPLRVYIYDGDVLLRFCSKKYIPFDPTDTDQYVVGDNYIPIWKMPSLKRSYEELKFGMKESLNIYLKGKGYQPKKIWKQIDESIASIFLNKEKMIIKIIDRYKNVGNFFEMMRLDFVVDENLNVFLMEANMSPNLSSAHFPPNGLLYENVLFNIFSLCGIARSTYLLGDKSTEEEEMEVSEKNLVVFGDECAQAKCKQCGSLHCILCMNCLTTKTLMNLKMAYLEHVNRKDCRRIFPPQLSNRVPLKELDLEQYSPENRLMVSWFLGKCHQDASWC